MKRKEKEDVRISFWAKKKKGLVSLLNLLLGKNNQNT